MNIMKFISKYKYQALCIALLSSLIMNVGLYHEKRIYEKGILQAMELLGLGGLENGDLSMKSQIILLNEYLQELWPYGLQFEER